MTHDETGERIPMAAREGPTYFEGLTGTWKFRVLGYREPKANDWYLSGNPPYAKLARAKMSASRWVVVPVQQAARFRSPR